MLISLIVAAAEDNAIGKENQLLWRLPNDLRFFKNKTWGLPVTLGRKTFESLSGEPLSGRLNIVITRSNDWQFPGTTVVHSLDEAVETAAANDYKELLVAGGGEIYQEAMGIAGKIYLTRVHARFPDADTHFPAVDESRWALRHNEDFLPDAKHAYGYSFQEWVRR